MTIVVIEFKSNKTIKNRTSQVSHRSVQLIQYNDVYLNTANQSELLLQEKNVIQINKNTIFNYFNT